MLNDASHYLHYLHNPQSGQEYGRPLQELISLQYIYLITMRYMHCRRLPKIQGAIPGN